MPQEYVARWIGGRIGAGATVFHFQSIASGTAAQGLANATRALMLAVAGNIPNDVSISFDSEVRELANDGTLLAAYPVSAPVQVTGAGSTVYANGTGVLVRHSTAAVIAGRRLIGRTFIVPMTASVFDTNGDVAAATQTTLNNAFTSFRTAAASAGADFAVWSRANAATAPVVTSVTQSRPTTLRTRNDRV